MGQHNLEINKKQGINLSSMLKSIKKSAGVIISLTVISSAWAFILINEYMPSKYTVRGSVAIIPKGEIGSAFNENNFVQAADKFYGLLDSEVFRQIVWDSLEEPEQSGDVLNIISEDQSNLIFFEGESNSPKQAFAISKAAINNYKKVFNYTEDIYSLDTFSAPQAKQIVEKSNNSILLSAATGGVVLFLGTLIAGLSYMFSTKVYTVEQAKRLIKGHYLGSIAYQKKNKDETLLITQASTIPAIVNDYRKVAINIDYLMKRAGNKVLMISSLEPSEGKSTVALNVAVTLRKLNRKVLLLDLDLRHPNLMRYAKVELSPTYEISKVLSGGTKTNAAYFKNYIQHHEELDIDYIFGSVVVSHEEQSIMDRLEELLNSLKSEYDYIILDTSPIGIVKETYLKASLAEEVMLVVKQGETRADLVNKVIDDFETSEISMIGFILNSVPTKE
ncbi:CpsD/CapB family tyrosine-protein kinase [Enterococcus sp. AZ109]|uniref:CpsD/CapB family tyrosine-protein kinase n=1 Tax=Enterococcus sp. AZ109 TaxID=2774634 RepID=UPI003F28A36E